MSKQAWHGKFEVCRLGFMGIYHNHQVHISYILIDKITALRYTVRQYGIISQFSQRIPDSNTFHININSNLNSFQCIMAHSQ